MRTLPLIAIAAAGIAGVAVAATPKTHSMDMPLPNGAVVHVEYVGDVAPKVTISPGPRAGAGGDVLLPRPIGDVLVPAPIAAVGVPVTIPMPDIAGFDRMIEDINRRTEQMVRQAQQIAARPAGAPGVSAAAYANAPAGTTSTTVVSVSNGGGTCTRTTEVVSQGAGKPPKVTSNVSGKCSDAPAAQPAPGHPA